MGLLVKLILFTTFLWLPNVLAKDAMLIIDMQSGFYREYQYGEGNPTKLKALLKQQVEAIKQAKSMGMPIVLVEFYREGTTHRDILDALGDYNYLRYIKETNGAFDDDKVGDLLRYLKNKEISNLVIAGANGRSCISATIKGAIECNYKVLAVDDLISDFNRHVHAYPFQEIFREVDAKSIRRVNTVEGCLDMVLKNMTLKGPF